MAEQSFFTFEPWGRGRPRGRGRGIGRGRARGRGRGRGLGVFLSSAQNTAGSHRGARQEHRVGPNLISGPVPRPKLPPHGGQPHFPLMTDVKSSDAMCMKEDVSPSSSSSSKRSCTEMDDDWEGKSKTFVKKRCRKSLSGSFTFPRSGDGIGKMQSSGKNKGGTKENWDDEKIQHGIENVEKIENWDDDMRDIPDVNEEDFERAANWKLVQKSQSSNKKIVNANQKPASECEGTRAAEQGQSCEKAIECLSDATNKSATCSSEDDGNRSSDDQGNFREARAAGVRSLSSPTAGSKSKPYSLERSKSESWINPHSPNGKARKKDRFKQRQRGGTIEECLDSSEDEADNDQTPPLRGKGRMKSSQLRQKISSVQKYSTQTAELKPDKSSTKEAEVQTMAQNVNQRKTSKMDVEGEGCQAADSLTDEEQWDSVIKKLSAGGVDMEEVPSTRSKLSEVSEANRYSVENQMDSPLSFNPGYRPRFCYPPPPYMSFSAGPPMISAQYPYQQSMPNPWSGDPYYYAHFMDYYSYMTTGMTGYQYKSPEEKVPPGFRKTDAHKFPEDTDTGLHEEEMHFCPEKASCIKVTPQVQGSSTLQDYVHTANESYDLDESICSMQEQESMACTADCDFSLQQEIIPQMPYDTTGQETSFGNVDYTTAGPYPWMDDHRESQPQETSSSFISSEDSVFPHVQGTPDPVEENTAYDYGYVNMNGEEEKSNTWHQQSGTSVEGVGPVRKSSRVWGISLKQLGDHTSEQYKETIPKPVQKTVQRPQRSDPPSYAAIVAARENNNNSNDTQEGMSSTGSKLAQPQEQRNTGVSRSTSQSFWSSNYTFQDSYNPEQSQTTINQDDYSKYRSWSAVTQGWRSSDETTSARRVSEPPNPKAIDPQEQTSSSQSIKSQSKFRNWSVGSQGWGSLNITPSSRRVSEPPNPTNAIKVLQRPRRLTMEAQVRGESMPKSSSWRNLSVPDDIVEVPYPTSDIDYIDCHAHIDLLYQRSNSRGTFAKFMLTNKFPDNFAGCVAIFCYPINFSPNYTLAEDLLKEANIWGSFGCHPHQAKHYDGIMEQRIKEWMSHPKTVALGEIGLDYSDRPLVTTSDHELQKMIFRRQLQLALDVKKPLVIHCRDAEEDTLRIMSEMVPRNHKIHRHCFTGPPDDAIAFLRAFPNSFIGLTALVTFPTATHTHQTACAIPLNRLLLETDTPYFVPRKLRGTKWSHPGMALLVAERIAQLKRIPLDDVLTAVRANTMTMYGI